ncbi:MAG: sigma-70 family RNA polymerase sigma factor [Tepidanaerobacteraceae bacterium]|jgi:RNA polymerase sigma factor (sigma-70 family)|nr:sigma-70 family RNA polymerase sigma factor [Tepidanaerobacteraceae bacterium]
MKQKERLGGLILKMKSGDEETFVKLIDTFSPMIRKYSYQTGYDDDFTQELIERLIYAIHRFNPEVYNRGKGSAEDYDMDLLEANLVIWVKNSIKYAVERLADKYETYNNTQLPILNCPVYDDNEEEMIDQIADENIDIAEEICSSIEVGKKLSKKLTEKEKTIIIHTILLGYTEAETARKMGISQQAVHKGKKRALEKLREEY